jgi:hypothetical protein
MNEQQDGDELSEIMSEEALVYDLSVVLMRLDGNDGDPHQLVWCGGPVPEPWGDVWQKYEPQAQAVLNAIGEGSARAMVEALSASSAQKEPGETGMDERKTDGVTACPPVGQDVAFNEAERLVLELRNAVWQAQSLAETREAEDALMQFLRRAFGVDVPDAGQPKGGA